MSLDKKHTKGFSLIEVTIVIALLGISIALVTAMVSLSKQMTMKEKLMTFQDAFSDDIADVIANPNLCSALLKQALSPSFNSISQNANNTDLDLNPKFFKALLPNPIFSFDSVKLNYVLDPPHVDVSDLKTSATYSGLLKFNVMFSDHKFDDFKEILRPVKIPIVIFDLFKENKWPRVQCGATLSNDSQLIGQICNLYGGTFTDGIHCDFLITNRKAYSNGSSGGVAQNIYANQGPFKLSQIANSPVRRASLSEVLCYLDHLIVMIPNYPKFQGRNLTRFCRHLGSKGNISPDAKEIFKVGK